MAGEVSPAARALLALEAIQNSPGITARVLGDRLGVTERAARRYVAILREAELPIESVSGPYGGYRVGRGLRLPPLTFTPAEATGLVMAVLEGHPNAADPADLIGGALAKILRVLPERVAGPVRTVREQTAEGPVPALAPSDPPPVSPELTTRLIGYCTAARRLRLTYRVGGADREMEVDPWAVVLRHSLWYLLCWSHTRRARRVLRVDRIAAASPLPEQFTPPPDLDALRALEEHLSQGWDYDIRVIVNAPVRDTARWLPRSLARLEPDGENRTLLRGSTSDPDWYARRLATLPVPFRVIGSPELSKALTALAQRLLASAQGLPASSLRPGRYMVGAVTGPGDNGNDKAPEAYYRPGPDGIFTATIATESPWDTKAQHGGPPCALIGHVIRENHPEPGFRIARLTVEFLGTIPRSDVQVTTEVVRDGRRIRLIEAAMTSGGKKVALARAWQIATGDDGLLAGAEFKGAKEIEVPALPAPQAQGGFGRKGWGYGESVEGRRVRGAYRGTGYAQVWMRPLIPLVAGQDMHPLDRVLVVADSANGVSARLEMSEWLYIPPAVTVTLNRYPAGEWVLISARSDLADDGLGSTTGTLSDDSGVIGSVTQPLLIARAPV